MKNKEIDMVEQFENMVNSKEKRKKRNFKVKLLVLLIIFIMIIALIYNMKSYTANIERINLLRIYGASEFEIAYSKKDLWQNGFYIYKVADIPEIEIHTVYNKSDNLFITDIESRYYKYYFEKWKNENKDKFIVQESYEDYTCKNMKKEDWILSYSTYIEVSNYDELVEATNDIINFLNYMDKDKMLVKSYIKYDGKLIMPHNVSDQSNEEILKSAERQFKEGMNY